LNFVFKNKSLNTELLVPKKLELHWPRRETLINGVDETTVLLKTPQKCRKLKRNKIKSHHKFTRTLAIFVEHGVIAGKP